MAESRYGSDIANLAKRLNQTTEREQSEGYGMTTQGLSILLQKSFQTIQALHIGTDTKMAI